MAAIGADCGLHPEREVREEASGRAAAKDNLQTTAYGANPPPRNTRSSRPLLWGCLKRVCQFVDAVLDRVVLAILGPDGS